MILAIRDNGIRDNVQLPIEQRRSTIVSQNNSFDEQFYQSGCVDKMVVNKMVFDKVVVDKVSITQ